MPQLDHIGVLRWLDQTPIEVLVPLKLAFCIAEEARRHSDDFPKTHVNIRIVYRRDL